jgi:Flp pilus assembly protein TadG
MLQKRRPGWRADDRGSAAIEFAITAVAVMAIMFAAIQAATWYWARSIALAAAQEGADAQRAYNADPGDGLAKANAFIASTGDGLNDATVSITSDAEQIQVTVVGRCLSVIPGFCNTVPVSATVHGTIERVTSP